MAELLIVMVVVGILMGLSAPVFSGKIEQARRLQTQNKMRSICQAYHELLLRTGAPIAFEKVADFAKELAKQTGLGANDGKLWFIEGDPKVDKTQIPKSALADWTVESSFRVAKKVSAHSPGHTPILWTRGLDDGTAFGDETTSPLGIKGGYIGFLDGKVVFCEKNDELYLSDGSDGKSNFKNDIAGILKSML